MTNKCASSDDAGKNSFMWIGPKPRVNIMNPDQIRDVFMKINEYQKPSHPHVDLEVTRVKNGLNIER
jgi:hypothetical protein